MTEREVLHAILTSLGALPDVRIFRNNVGLARDPSTGQHVRFGLTSGASDILGIVQPAGRWLALEVKSATGRVRPEQVAFLEMVRRMGGVAGVVRSVDDALQLLNQARDLQAREPK